MSIEQAVHERWRDDGPITSLVPAERLFTGEAVGGPALPYVVLRRKSQQPLERTSDTRLDRARIELAIWSDDLDCGKRVAAEVVRLVERTTLTSDTETVLNMQPAGRREERSDDGTWLVALEYDALITH